MINKEIRFIGIFFIILYIFLTSNLVFAQMIYTGNPYFFSPLLLQAPELSQNLLGLSQTTYPIYPYFFGPTLLQPSQSSQNLGVSPTSFQSLKNSLSLPYATNYMSNISIPAASSLVSLYYSPQTNYLPIAETFPFISLNTIYGPNYGPFYDYTQTILNDESSFQINSQTPTIGDFEVGEEMTLAEQEELNRIELENAILNISQPDALLLVINALERYLDDYPNGQSDFERTLSDLLVKSEVDYNTISLIVDKIRPFKPILENRAAPEFKNLDINRPIDSDLLLLLHTEEYISESLSSAGPIIEPSLRMRSSIIQPDHKYWIELKGIKSHRCADDVGWEIGCDREEPYVAWLASSPDYLRYGVTEKQSDMVKGSERFFSQYNQVLSASPSSTIPIKPEYPLFFIYQVIESDPGGPSNSEIAGAMQLGFYTGLALYNGNWISAAYNGGKLIIEWVDIFTKLAGGGDDLYPIMLSVFNEDRLYTLTSCDSPGPLDEEPFDSAGCYDRYNIRAPYIDGGWQVLYIITRQTVYPKLRGLTISGPSVITLGENSCASYRAKARFSNGTTADVTDCCQWTVTANCVSASMNSSRLCVANAKDKCNVSVNASYTYKGVTKIDSKEVTIYPRISSLIISGPSEIMLSEDIGSSCALYEATATFFDGTTKDVTGYCQWTIKADDVDAFMDSSSLCVENANKIYSKNVIVNASYTYNGITKSASKSVKIYPELIKLTISGPFEIIYNGFRHEPECVSYSAIAELSNGLKDDVTIWCQWTVNSPTISSVYMDSSELCIPAFMHQPLDSNNDVHTLVINVSYSYQGDIKTAYKFVNIKNATSSSNNTITLTPGDLLETEDTIEFSPSSLNLR